MMGGKCRVAPWVTEEDGMGSEYRVGEVWRICGAGMSPGTDDKEKRPKVGVLSSGVVLKMESQSRGVDTVD
jgi:hypothetical protein